MKPAASLALSIRQPWAYLIIHAGKDVENREWPTRVRGNILIHAGKTMTRADYQACCLFCSSLPDGAMPADFEFPSFERSAAPMGSSSKPLHRSISIPAKAPSDFLNTNPSFYPSHKNHQPRKT